MMIFNPLRFLNRLNVTNLCKSNIYYLKNIFIFNPYLHIYFVTDKKIRK